MSLLKLYHKNTTVKILIAFFTACLVLIVGGIAFAWGSWGHKHISRAAVFSLPEPMRIFYYNHIDYITESAVVPDLRRPLLNDRNEAPRHFIDLEDFGDMPLSSFPKTMKDAYVKYDSTFLNKAGILPWNIESLTEKLTKAFHSKNKSEILFLSSEISHYVADAHMPLHTSSNYNGQLSGQKGVHALWESVLPPMFGDQYNFHTATPQYIADINAYTWKMIEQSHSQVKPLLDAEMRVRKKFDTTTMYKRDAEGNKLLFYGSPVFSDAYAAAFNAELGNMVQYQLRLSVYDVACYWFTAWVNAGKPDLIKLDDPHLTKQNRKNYRKEYQAWKKGKLMNMTVDKE